MKIDWKSIANWMKLIVGLEMLALVIFVPSRPALDIILIGLAQYAIFFPVDASIIIGNLKKVESAVTDVVTPDEPGKGK